MKIAIYKDRRGRPMFGMHGNHLAAKGLPGVEVVGYCDSDPNEANLAEALRVSGASRVFTDLSAMLDATRPDILILCNRHPHEHEELYRAALSRGIHILSEKPLFPDLETADRVLALADAHGAKIAASHRARYDASFCTVHRLIREGAIGTPTMAFTRGKCDHRGGGEDLAVLGMHLLDLLQFWFGMPERVYADVRLRGRPIVVADATEKTAEPIGPVAGDDVHALFTWENGFRAVFDSRRNLPGVRDAGIVQMGITVCGTAGTIAVGFNDADSPSCPIRLCRSARPPERGYDVDWETVPSDPWPEIPGAEPVDDSIRTPDLPTGPGFHRACRAALWDLIGSIREGREPVSSGRTAALTQEMVQGIFASGLSRAPVSFPLVDRRSPFQIPNC